MPDTEERAFEEGCEVLAWGSSRINALVKLLSVIKPRYDCVSVEHTSL